VKYSRVGDQGSTAFEEEKSVDLSPFVGSWVNTKKDTTGFVRLLLTNAGEKLLLRAFAASSSEPCDWGEVEAFGFSDDVNSYNGRAFSALYDTGSIEVALQGNLNLGLLVLVTFNRFKDGSGRANYICREFFHR
jgi:hypothetical protein